MGGGGGGGEVSFCNLLDQTFILPTFVPVFCCFCSFDLQCAMFNM